MPRLRPGPARRGHRRARHCSIYDLLFGDRDPVAEPGTATGTPGDWWTVFALVPDIFEHAVHGFAALPQPDAQARPGAARARPDPRRLGARQPVRVLPALQVAARRWASEEKIAAVAALAGRRLLRRARAGRARLHRLPRPRRRPRADELFDALQAHLADEEILELTYITCLYDMHAVMSRALRIEFDDRDEPIVEVAAPEGYGERDIAADISLPKK